MWSSRSDSSWAIRVTGMPVHIATTWAISSSSTTGCSPDIWACHSVRRPSAVSRAVASASRRAAASSYSWLLIAASFSLRDAVEVLLGVAQRGRRGRVAQADPRRGLVDEVDRLVRQVAVRDVAGGQVGGGLDRVVADGHLVVLLVALADAHEDLDGLLEGRLLHHDRLEAALEGGVALDVLAVLVERRRADALELAARQRRLEDVGGVDGALGRAGPDERVQLVDEQDGVVRVAQLLDDLLEPLLELAAVLGAGDERPDVEGQRRACSAGCPGTSPATIRWARPSAIAVLPTPGSPMRAGLFFVLRPRIWMTRSISFSLPMTGSSFPARAASVRLMPELVDGRRLAGALRLLGGRPGGRALRQDPDDFVADLVEVHAERLEHTGGDPLALADEAQEQVLRADVVVAEAAGLVDGQLDDPLRARRQADLADDRAIAAADDELDGGPDLGQLDVHVLEHTRGHALALADEAQEQVLRADVVVVEPLRFVLRECQDLACPVRELVEAIHPVERPFRYASPAGAALQAMLARHPVPGDGRRPARSVTYRNERTARPDASARVRNRNDPSGVPAGRRLRCGSARSGLFVSASAVSSTISAMPSAAMASSAASISATSSTIAVTSSAATVSSTNSSAATSSAIDSISSAAASSSTASRTATSSTISAIGLGGGFLFEGLHLGDFLDHFGDGLGGRGLVGLVRLGGIGELFDLGGGLGLEGELVGRDLLHDRLDRSGGGRFQLGLVRGDGLDDLDLARLPLPVSRAASSDATVSTISAMSSAAVASSVASSSATASTTSATSSVAAASSAASAAVAATSVAFGLGQLLADLGEGGGQGVVDPALGLLDRIGHRVAALRARSALGSRRPGATGALGSGAGRAGGSRPASG